MQASPAFEIRQLKPDEIGLIIDWMAAEGWNPGLRDAEAFVTADPQGFFVGEVGGRAVACGSAVRYDEHFAFCGCYIVAPEYRQLGYGWQLTQARLRHVGERITGIDGVVAMQAQYAEIGYQVAYRNTRYMGVAQALAEPEGLEPLAGLDLAMLSAYDARIFPAARAAFLDAWRRLPGHFGLALTRGNQVLAYGLRRPCRQGWKIGPLFADDLSLAEQLLDGLLLGIPGETYYLDVPEPNSAAAAIVHKRALKPVFETARMYRNGRPREDIQRVFGITTFELG